MECISAVAPRLPRLAISAEPLLTGGAVVMTLDPVLVQHLDRRQQVPP